MKRGCILIVIFLFAILPLTKAQLDENDLDALINGQDVAGSAPAGTTVQLPQVEAEIEGEFSQTDGRITADEIKIEDQEFIGVDNLEITDENTFTASSIEQFNTETVEIQGATNVEVDEGTIKAEQVDVFVNDDTANTFTLTNAKDVTYDGNTIKASQADSLVRDQSITTQLQNLESQKEHFTVKQADSFNSGCVKVENINDATFTIDQTITIEKESDEDLLITDCAYNEATVKGTGTVEVDKSSDATYTIDNLTIEFENEQVTEIITANNTATIETDSIQGITFVTLTTPASYIQSNNQIEKSFALSTDRTSPYSICIKQSTIQPCNTYDALLDFPANTFLLTKSVNYKRYPLQNNQVSDLLFTSVYRGAPPSRATLLLDGNLVHIDSVQLSDPSSELTSPSTYYTVTENSGQQFLKLNQKRPSQSLVKRYQTQVNPDITITNDLFIQRDQNTITVLPPNHPDIQQLLS